MGNVEGVAIVGNVEQLSDVRLTRIPTVVQAERALLAELVSEVEGGRKVGHGTDGIHIFSTIVLHEIGALWLEDTGKEKNCVRCKHVSKRQYEYFSALGKHRYSFRQNAHFV